MAGVAGATGTGSLQADSDIEQCDELTRIDKEPREEAEGRPGDQGNVTEQGGTALAISRSPGPPGHPSGSALGSQSIHYTALC